MPEKPHQPDYVLYFTIVILSAVGIVTVYSASTDLALQLHKAPDHYAVRQLLFAIIGLLAMFAFMRIQPRTWYRLAPFLMVVNLSLLVLVKLFGHTVAGGKRWLGTSSLYIQPSELAIVCIAMYLAFFFTKKVTVLQNFKQGFVPAIIIIMINFGLIFIEPDMGTAMTLFGTAFILLLASGTPLRRVIGLVAMSVPALLYLALSGSYRSGRLLAFLHPFTHQTNASYQLLAGWTAMSAGGWFGRGFGMSLAKTGYLPESNTDFIFPVFVEEWGYVGGIALIITFGVLIWRGFLVARHAPTRFTALYAVGLTSGITMGAIINLGAVTGLLPVTGIPLPFISYGGTDLVVNLAAMGMLVAISRYTVDEEPDVDQLAEVIEVDNFAAAPPTRRRTAPRETVASPRRTAKVQAIRPKKADKRTTADTWRSRQETAAASSTRKQSNAATKPSGGSWRDRQQRAEAWQTSERGQKPRTGPRKSPTRKGRNTR